MRTSFIKRPVRAAVTVAAVALSIGALSFATSSAAEAAEILNGPIALGTSSTYGVLAASAITNTGPTVVNGDIGVSPQSSITGFTGAPNGSNIGATNDDNAAALQAQSDLTTAFNSAAGLSPTTSGLHELTGLSLTPGVYSGGTLALSNNGTLTLAGTSANSIWVFQAASSLTIGSATHIVITGGASACNVFWEVGSSASLGTGAQFQGTILAKQSITAATQATITGRLLANNAAVTLQSNTITVPTGCAAGSPTSTSGAPAITSGTPTSATAGNAYGFTVTASGTPSPTFTISNGTLPAGLALNGLTGVISGTPSASGTATFTVTASNGAGANASAIYTLVVAAPSANASTAQPSNGTTAAASGKPKLALTGVNTGWTLITAGGLGAIGALLFVAGYRRRSGRHSA